MKNKVIILSICILSAMLFLGCTIQQKAEAVRQKEINEIELQSEVVSESTVLYDEIPMVMVQGKMYYMTDKESTQEAKCGVMDGEITSAVGGTEVPTQNDQSNFGTGYGYQIGHENTIEVNMDNKWVIFEYQSEEDTNTVEGTVNEVVIEAHIKEIKENTMIISSDSDEYPGAFFIDVQDTMEEISDLKGGDSIIIHMMDKNRENQGMKEFLAYSILPREEQEELTGKHDILLTEAPILSLTDVLSSTRNELKLQSGNYEWNYKNGEQMEGIVACGSVPMEEETENIVKTLSIPDYNGLDKVVYSVNTVISPDKIAVTEWNVSDVGKEQAEPTRIVQYYCSPYLLELKSDAVYEIMAEWNENKLDINGFYGIAIYYVNT